MLIVVNLAELHGDPAIHVCGCGVGGFVVLTELRKPTQTTEIQIRIHQISNDSRNEI